MSATPHLDQWRADLQARGVLTRNSDRTAGDALTFRTLRAWRATYTPPRWLIRGFLVADAFDVFGGAEKSLKSWLMHHVAISIAAGVPLFGVEEFIVTKPGPVLLLTGEGGVDLVLDRIEHLCTGMYEVDVDDALERIIVSADIAPMTSPHFAADVAAAITTYDPVLVQLDPLYVYFGEDREAGNVFSTGPALARLRQLTTGRACQTAHHFTKAAADRLTLASLTQAGMREAVDHWLLIAVSEHDLIAQRFVLDMERGARRGLAWSRSAEIVLGPFDTDTLKHVGTPSFAWVGREKDRATRALKRKVSAAIQAHPGINTRGLLLEVSGTAEKVRGARDVLAADGLIRVEEGPNRQQLHYPISPYIEE